MTESARVVVDGPRYRFHASDVRLTVDASVGARVVEFSIDGDDALLGPSVHAENYGSTFWTSPQKDWGWPPPAALDRGPYRATVRDDHVVFDAIEPTPSGLAAQKVLRVGSEGAVHISYALENRGRSNVVVAPWEVTRVERRGVSFFPRRSRTHVESPFPPLETDEIDGIAWVDHSRPVAKDRKLYAEGSEGWLAHATDKFVLVKRFDDLPDGSAAPGEAGIEIFANAAPPYVELEQQGPLAELSCGSRALWNVAWRIVRLPVGARLAVGEPALVELARSIAGSLSNI